MTSANSQFLPGAGVAGMVSIIIPSFNRADIIGDTLQSVLGQTYSNFEIIVVDDGSTDDTAATVGSFADERIRYFYKPNGGLSAARNSGLDRARGEFIAFLDSDDVWESWKLEAQMRIFEKHADVGMTWSDMSTFQTLGTIISPRHLREYYSAYSFVDFESGYERAGTLGDLTRRAPLDIVEAPYYLGDVFEHMFNGNLVHPSTAVVRRSRLQLSGPFEPRVTGLGAEDYHFYFRICSHGLVAFLDAPTTLYRVHSAQLSTCNRLHEARGNLNVVNHWLERRPKDLPSPVVRRSLANSHAWLGAEELTAGNKRVASKHLWKSLRMEFRQPDTLALLVVSLLPRSVAETMRALKRALRRSAARPLIGVALLLIDDMDVLSDLMTTVQSSIVNAV
jgi:glycosyltransferase involved in cell wall biosynthesis